MKDNPRSRDLREHMKRLSAGNVHPEDALPEALRARLSDLSPEERRKRARLWHLLEGLLSADTMPGDAEPIGDDEAWAELQTRIRSDTAPDTTGRLSRESPSQEPSPTEREQGEAKPSAPSPPEANSRGGAAGVDVSPNDATSNVDARARLRGERPPREKARSAPDGLGDRVRWGVAVVAALAVIVVAYTWFAPVRVEAPVQEQITYALPDGSAVTLASGSTLEYSRGFRFLPFIDAAERSVELDGEAYFDIVSAERSFVVSTFNARIEVLGTQFNVRARADDRDRSTRVTLLDGDVRVSTPAGGDSRLLSSPGSAAIVPNGHPPKRVQDIVPDRAAAWRRGGFSATRLPLGSVLRDLERRFGIHIETADDVDQSTPLTLHYGFVSTAKTIIHDVCLSEGLRFRPTNKGYEIYNPATQGTPSGDR